MGYSNKFEVYIHSLCPVTVFVTFYGLSLACYDKSTKITITNALNSISPRNNTN